MAEATKISIHAPHEGERHIDKDTLFMAAEISIHAPHEGERRCMVSVIWYHIYFNPRSPRGGATKQNIDRAQAELISIHAPHEGERRNGKNDHKDVF